MYTIEVSSSSNSGFDNEERGLEYLLDAFGIRFSLEEITSAYLEAGRNADMASEILHGLQGSTSSANGRASKAKVNSVSMGTVSSVLGKDYLRATPAGNGLREATKPLKLNTKDLPVAGFNKQEVQKDVAVNVDIEEFMFKMLGDGFQLERGVIQEVLGYCGYDVNKSMEKLLDMLGCALDEVDNFRVDFTGKGRCLNAESLPKSPQDASSTSSMGSYDLKTSGKDLSKPKRVLNEVKETSDIGKEILASLFHVPGAPKESFDKISVRSKTAKGSMACEKPVTEPQREDYKSCVSWPDDEDGVDDDDGYMMLRTAVKEYRTTMKEYYKAAAEAFSQGDRVRADKLLEQGQFFHAKAREADEESARKIFEIRDGEAKDPITLDLHELGAKEAIRLLECHLSSLSGIPSMKYLKIIMETSDKDTSKGARKRKILKLLEKESIKWTEAGNAGTILIRIDKINPKRLTFAPK
ncbi:protein of unknown function DUF1771 [Dillenia turbinata]|uniref:DUF1771 domain-containing protein n=1 Tax=Dillenia turbinata TaxID=194707 RepID=A0AAN8ZG26_9MAGN